MFYVDPVQGGKATLTGETADHLRKVLRAEAGQKFELSDGVGVYLGEIAKLGKDTVEFSVIETLPARRQGAAICLCAALIKFDHFEWIIEKASELGVRSLVPVVAARCDAGLDRAVPKRMTRWRRIAEESGQQCRRVRPLIIEEMRSFRNTLKESASTRIVLDEAGGSPLLKVLRPITGAIDVLCGPEGGWTEQERTDALTAGWTLATLGEQILRAETAALAGVSIIQANWWASHSL
jgi:16S rRNA (uracil1498-N3)-methyltransferase